MGNTKIKVLMLSIWYPLSMSRYFERAFKRREDVDLITVGSYTGAWIPWMGGMTLSQKYALPPTLALPFPPSISNVPYDLVRANLPKEWKPDIVLTVDAGVHWTHKPNEGLVAHVATDPHALNYDYQRTISDKFFNMQRCYSEQEDIYLPYAYDPTVHYPIDPPLEKDMDAVLIGMPYEQRVRWVDELRKHGVKVSFENGPVFEEYRQINNQARIGLNWSSLNDTNARAFELPAMGLAPVMNVTPDMGEFFLIGEDYSGFYNFREAVDNVLELMNHPEEVERISANALNAVRPHTYDARVNQIFTECGF